MKLKVSRELLLKPLQIVTNVVERRQNNPILANALLRVNSEYLTLTGTDLEVEMIVTLPITTPHDGDTTLPARKFLDLCRSLPELAELDLSVDKDKAVIRSGRSRFTLATLPAADFPEIETASAQTELLLSQSQLKSLIDQTQFAMAQQDVRYYLNGLLLDVHPERVTAVATDGHRLAYSQLTLATGVSVPVQAIIPRKGVTELLRLLETTEDKITLQLSSNHLRVRLPQVIFTTKLIDGKFPDYDQVVPKHTNKSMQVNRQALHQVFTRIAVLSNEKFRSMRLQLTKNLLKASVHNPEQEEAEEEMEVMYSGEDVEIGFNISYFLDALAAIRQDEVVVHFTDTHHSCLVHGVNDISSRYVIMPMRL
ncbi:MAG: DNA polymerase III subunit beta [Gammaproteobacteria bacterium]|nr:DNA polymerase III subunit beta [Gammaproteobacteria bacterium]